MRYRGFWIAVALIILCGLGATHYTRAYETEATTNARSSTGDSLSLEPEEESTGAENPYTESETLSRLRELDDQIARNRTADSKMTPNARKVAAEKERRLWDTEMNRILDELETTLPDEERAALFTEQNEWVRSREALASEASDNQASVARKEMEYNRSFAESTRERSYELAETYESYLFRAE